jgi:hypothetical protein
MKTLKYVSMGIVALSAVATATAVGWFIYVGRDPKMTTFGALVAVPFALALGGAIGVGGCIFLDGRRPRARLGYSLVFLALAALVWCGVLL